MKVVYAPGCWDLLHVGHVAFLKRAKALGDRLIVGVPSDSVVLEDKGKLPIITLTSRMEMLASLRCVDRVASYHKLDFMSHLREFRPDVLAVGEFWGRERRHKDAELYMGSNGGAVVTIPYTQEESTTQIIERIRRA